MDARPIPIALAAIAVAVILAFSTRAEDQPEPEYEPKPPTWRSMLVTNDGEGVTDEQLAGWIKNAQTMAGQQQPARSFSLIATFTQCFGGAFVTELAAKGVDDFGANSASRYYEPASYDTVKKRSYYAFAWKEYAATFQAFFPRTDRKITLDAYDAIASGNINTIPRNPSAARERAQYLDDDGNNNTPPPSALAADQHNYAILFVGQPNRMDQTDVTDIHKVLTTTYRYDDDEILILYGDGTDPDLTDNWEPTFAATAGNLQQAFAFWLQFMLFTQPQDEDSAQVFFWVGDHGNVDFPISMSVEFFSVGQLGSDVDFESSLGRPVEKYIYEAGSGTNIIGWEEPTGQAIDAMAFGDDFPAVFFSQSEEAVTYFSVDFLSEGAAKSGVAREIALNRAAAPDVFAITQNSNRQAFDGSRSLGLQEGFIPDDLDALAMRDILNVADPENNVLFRPLFYSIAGSSDIWVYDPMVPVGMQRYPYYVFPNPAPDELDALALRDDGKRDPMNNNKLKFEPNIDQMLFSVGRNESKAPWKNFDPCDILKLGPGAVAPAVWLHCAQIGLDKEKDNLNALDLGTGPQGEPTDPPYEPPEPEPPYPDDPPYPDPPDPDEPPAPDPPDPGPIP